MLATVYGVAITLNAHNLVWEVILCGYYCENNTPGICHVLGHKLRHQLHIMLCLMLVMRVNQAREIHDS